MHPRTVLDLGCGEGWLSRALAAEGLSVTGIDGSAELIDAANEIGGATFRQLFYDQLPSLNATFDAIVVNFSLFDENLDPILAAIRALLAPAGSLIIQTLHPAHAESPDVDGWRVETFQNMPGTWPEPMPWYHRTLASWHELFARTGWVVRATDEPLHPETRRPLSILFICSPVV